jgi:hypothetical protein
VARILSAIYEQDFVEGSYGYRPGRNPHQALRALRSHLIVGKVQYVYETDIRGYVTRINHDWLRQMVAHRIADPVILRLVGKWLRAGVMQDGVVVRTKRGVSQGNPISPVLANVYLHYVLDLWFERRFRRHCRGEIYLIRFVDDFVAVFQNEGDANAFDRELAGRMQEFGLELKPGKTRLLLFGRSARRCAAASGEKPATFEFLGFNMDHRDPHGHDRCRGPSGPQLRVGTVDEEPEAQAASPLRPHVAVLPRPVRMNEPAPAGARRQRAPAQETQKATGGGHCPRPSPVRPTCAVLPVPAAVPTSVTATVAVPATGVGAVRVGLTLLRAVAVR